MAIAFGQNLGDLNTASGTSLSGTFGSSTVSGNLVLGAARVGVQGRTQTFSDSKSNTWASNPIELDFLSGNHLVVGYAKNITGGASHQVTLSISGAAASIRMVIWEESGLDTSAPLDQTQTNVAAVETLPVDSDTTATTTQADEWVFVVGAWDGSSTIAAGTGYGNLIGAPSGTAKKMGAEDKIVAATGTQNGTITVAAGLGTWGAAILTFKAATGGGTKAVTPSAITSTSAMSGAVQKLAAVKPAAITSTSAMSGSVVKLAAVKPAAITATSAMSGAVTKLGTKAIIPAAITSTSTVTGAVVKLAAVKPAGINATSNITGTVSGGTSGATPLRSLMGLGL